MTDPTTYGAPAVEPELRATAQRLAVLGSPIEHSRSPQIHRAAYAALGLDWSYTRVRCGAAGLEAFLRGRGPEWRGFSVTMPLKEEAHRIATVLDPVATESGVVNTLFRIVAPGDAAPRWAGYNTDVPGLAAAISRAGLDARRTIVLGSGATAVSALLAARRLGAEGVTILARNTAAIADLVARFDGTSEPMGAAVRVSGAALGTGDGTAVAGAADATLVISALPGPVGRGVALPAGVERAPLFDVAYDPWPSPLAERWRAAGGVAHPGLDMLVEQALVQARIFVAGEPSLPLPDEAALLGVMHGAADLPRMER